MTAGKILFVAAIINFTGIQFADKFAAAFSAKEPAGNRKPVFFISPVMFPAFYTDNFLNLLPLVKRNNLLSGDLDIFNQFTIRIILISGVKRLFRNTVYAAFIEEHF